MIFEAKEKDPVREAILAIWGKSNIPFTNKVIIERRHLNALINKIMEREKRVRITETEEAG